MSLDKAFYEVRSFHKAFGHPCPNQPTLLPADRVEKRAGWINDEVQELRDAKTIVDQVDACFDIIYFGLGTLVELGVIPSPLWDIVHGANMAKLGPDGKPLYHPDGKTKKPDGWEPPEPQMLAEIVRQFGRANAID